MCLTEIFRSTYIIQECCRFDVMELVLEYFTFADRKLIIFKIKYKYTDMRFSPLNGANRAQYSALKTAKIDLKK